MERRLAAIMVADVVDYTRLMGTDESRTLGALNVLRENLFQPKVNEANGEIIKRMGDGWIVEFPSVYNAVSCAIGIQEGLLENEFIRLRIGVHIGDITIQDDDIYGDGINVASRLEALAEPGQVLISDIVHHSLDTNTVEKFKEVGIQQLKNVVRPVGVWHWQMGPETPFQGAGTEGKGSPKQPDKPSIAVLPFNNLSSDPEQEFFADGIVEDLITALSRFPWLFVIARNSSFSYKGKSVLVKQVANDLGVRYVVEGSVRSSPTRLRIAVQLIDATTDHHVWAENYDRPIGDFFDLQDEITQSITGVLVPALSGAERDRSLRDNRPDLDAWRTYQRGLGHFYRPYNDVDHAEARRLLDRAVELDKDFSDAHAMIALMGIYVLDSGQSSYNANRNEVLEETERAARLAVQCDDSSSLAHMVLGRVYGHRMDFQTGIAECKVAVQLNPNLAIAHHELGVILFLSGQYEEAIPCFDQAIRLSPNDPSRWNFYLLKGMALYGLERFEDSIIYYREAARQRPTAFWPHLSLAASFSALNRMDEAHRCVEEALSRKPDLNITFLTKIAQRFNDPPSHIVRWVNDLSKTKLPE